MVEERRGERDGSATEGSGRRVRLPSASRPRPVERSGGRTIPGVRRATGDAPVRGDVRSGSGSRDGELTPPDGGAARAVPRRGRGGAAGAEPAARRPPSPLAVGAAPASDRSRAGRRLALPSDARADDLDPDVRRDLRGLAPATAEQVARHLVAAGRLLDEEPRQALAHARAARALAGRVAAVREAAGLAAYHVGEFAEALAELRAARRLDGSPRHLPVMADAERGLGRPERALALAADPAAARLDAAGRVELLVVASGARRDLGQADAALVTLQGPDLDSPTVRPWTPRLWYAYAEALLAAGRVRDAADCFDAVATVDEGETDAAGRAAALRTSAEDGGDTRT